MDIYICTCVRWRFTKFEILSILNKYLLVIIYLTTFEKGTQRYKKNKLCKNHEVETNQREKQPITILSKEPTPAN